jgi:THUMP domain-like/Conserved hypothetical protein 95
MQALSLYSLLENMNHEQITNPEVQQFIIEHENSDVSRLLLGGKSFFGVDTKVLVQQISGRKKIQDKLPTWHQTKGIIYPPSVNLEQCSSEATAKFKLDLLKELFDFSPIVVDLTGGFGVDSTFFSKFSKRVYYVELNPQLFEIAKQNFKKFEIPNVVCQNDSAESFLNSSGEIFDVIFLDPSRRKENKKVFRFQDCEPDHIKLQDQLFQMSERILIKASPMLDLHQGIKELGHVEKAYVLSVENECKEVLFLQKRNFTGTPVLQAIELDVNGSAISSLSFTVEDELNARIDFGDPLTYLYEPNAAILKAGAFKLIGQVNKLLKLAPNTHFYTSSTLVKNFPGRIFKILGREKLDKNLGKKIPGGQINIITRNYPLAVESIKKKTGLKDGGNFYLICTQGRTEKFYLVAERLK